MFRTYFYPSANSICATTANTTTTTTRRSTTTTAPSRAATAAAASTASSPTTTTAVAAAVHKIVVVLVLTLIIMFSSSSTVVVVVAARKYSTTTTSTSRSSVSPIRKTLASSIRKKKINPSSSSSSSSSLKSSSTVIGRRWISSLRGGDGSVGGHQAESTTAAGAATAPPPTYRTVQVQAIHRHGDRTPITPLRDEKYWSSTLVSQELLERVAAGTKVLRPTHDDDGKDGGHNDSKSTSNNHAAGGRGPFGKLTQMGLLQMVQVGEQIKIDLEQHTEWSNQHKTNSSPFSIRPQDIKIYCTDFPRTIQSVQGALVGFFPDANPSDGNDVLEDITIDCRHTISWMIPDPQPRRTKEQEHLESELSHRPHMIEREDEMRPLAVRCTKALHPFLGEGAFNMAFGVGEDNKNNKKVRRNTGDGEDDDDDHVHVLPWAQLAEITKCLQVRDMLPPEITVEDQEAVSSHTAWRWFESLRNPRLAFLSMHIFTNKIVESFQDAIVPSHDKPKLILYSCHDSSLIGLLCAFHLEQPTEWPEYGSVLKIELLEKRVAAVPGQVESDPEMQTATGSSQVEYVVRFSLNGEHLRSMWHGTLRDEIDLDKLHEYISTVGATTTGTSPGRHTTTNTDIRGGSIKVATKPSEKNQVVEPTYIIDDPIKPLPPPPPPRPSTVWEQAQSVPNMITLSRLASTPLLCYWIVNGDYNLALYGLVAAAFSDGLDGYIAKNHGGGTVLGTYLDPLADKFLVNGLGISLWYAGILPTPLVSVWALKDILLLGGTGWYLYKEQHTVNFLSNSVATKPLTVTPTFLGKANTGLQFATLSIGVVSPVLGPDIIPPEMLSKLCWLTGITTVASLFSYTGKSGIKTAQNNNSNNKQ